MGRRRKTAAGTRDETLDWIRNPADEAAHAAGMRFDPERAAFAIEWIEENCYLYEGEKAGTPVILLPAWKDLFSRLYGWVYYSEEWGGMIRRFNRAAFWGAKKNGKPIAVDTLVPTTRGMVRMGDLTNNDVVFDETGAQTRIVAVSEIMYGRDCYLMRFGGGVEIVAADDHNWPVEKASKLRDATRGKMVPCIKSTAEIALAQRGKRRPVFRIKVPNAMQMPNVNLPIDPYWLGFWLGNGKRGRGDITIRTRDIPTVLPLLIDAEGEVSSDWDNPGESRHYYFSGMVGRLDALGLKSEKYIPESYFLAGTEQRWSLLQGLMDSDGSISKMRNQCIYSTSDARLRDGVVRLLSSLGFKATCNTVSPNESNRQTKDNYRVLFTGRLDQAISKLSRKLNNIGECKAGQRSEYRAVESCEPCESVPVRCIQVEAKSHLFLLTESCIPTHNSPMCAAHNLYLLCGDGEQGQKVYQAAMNGQQATIAQKHAINMVRQSPMLSEDCKINNTTMQIAHLESNSFLTILAGDDERGAKAKEGLNGSVSYDEMHVVSRAVEERTSRAGISRREPINASFSTAGDDPSSVGYERCAYGRQVNAGERADLRFLHVEYAAPERATVAEIEKNLDEYGRLANPAWGTIVKPSEFREDWERSKGKPREVARFKQYRLDMWVGSTNQWLDSAGWDRGEEEFTLADLAGRNCDIGLDLSRTTDMTACVFSFAGEGEEVKLFPLLWIPEDTAKERDAMFPYLSWAAGGHLRLTPGNVVDYAIVLRDIRAAINDNGLSVGKVQFDPHYAEEITQKLCDGETGIPGHGEREVFKQNLMAFTGPCKEFERRVKAGLVKHPKNSVLTWQAGHCEVWSDANQNIRPVKPKPGSAKTIDGIVSSVMACRHVFDGAGEFSQPSISWI